MNSRTSQRVAVIGLGRFGMALARRLSQHGAEVIAIDRQHKLIEEICNDVAIAVRLDSSEEAALRSQEVERVDCVVVAIGENFEAALLTTAICKKNLKVPKVICRAQTTLHAEIFRQIGADEVIQPEQNAGEMVARRLAHPRIHDYVKLGDGFTIVELLAPSHFVGKTLKELNLRSTYRVNLIAIRRTTDTPDAEDQPVADQIISVPGPDDRIDASDILLLSGSDTALSNLPRK
ncbi:MAG: TrkA family potassium uptake protein [Fuerstiella sp.]|nr:TrkA family potassium uptake protein [Fuerstiella sp.]